MRLSLVLSAIITTKQMLSSLFSASPSYKRLSWPDGLRVLHMSHKYDFRKVRAQALHELKTYFPSTLSEHDSMMPSPITSEFFIRTIIVAHETNALELLLSALYLISRLSIPTLNEILSNDTLLSRDDIITILLGRTRVINGQKNTYHAYIYNCTPSDSCDDASACQVHYADLLRECLEAEFEVNPSMMGFPVREDVFSFCRECFAHNEASHAAGRFQFWQGLPTYFGFESWEVLEEEEVT